MSNPTRLSSIAIAAACSLGIPGLADAQPAAPGQSASATPAPPASGTATASAPERWKGVIDLPGGVQLEFVVAQSAGPDGLIARMDIPMQGVSSAPLQDVAREGDILRFTLKPPGAPEAVWAKFQVTVDDGAGTASGSLSQAGGTFPVRMTRLAAGETGLPRRPQDPVPPFPYAQEEVTYTNAEDGTRLAGTLTIPEGPGPHPAVVLITGSGPQDRDEALMGHRPFLVLADHLTRQGIAVLRSDDRGVGGSTGSVDAGSSTIFAGDALAGVALLKARPEIDPARIGLVGHSEGGIVAPIAAARSRDVAFIVLLAGTGVPGRDVLREQRRLVMKAEGVADQQVEGAAESMDKAIELAASGADNAAVEEEVRAAVERELEQARQSTDPAARQQAEQAAASIDAIVRAQAGVLTAPWFRSFLAFDPREALRQVRCPVLAINGSLDAQVSPAQNLPEIRKALEEAGNTDVTIVELHALNHLFQTCETGAPSRYQKNEETFAPKALEVVSTWIRARTGLAPAQPGGTP